MIDRDQAIAAAEREAHVQVIYDDRCGWCQTHARHMRDEHDSSIATYRRVFRR